MKYVIVIPDGCADEPQETLGGRTPLQAARMPSADRLAAAGVVGRATHVPDHLPPGSAVANMSLLGYDPNEHFTGRAPLEAAAQGIELGDGDWAIRCNLVTIEDQVMQDFTAGHITTEEATELLRTAQEKIESEGAEFVAGVSYRNLLIDRSADRSLPYTRDTRTTPPHDLTGQSVVDSFPRGPGSDRLSEWMRQSVTWFDGHPVNRKRLAEGRRPATNIWLWGLGQRPHLAPFEATYGVRGTMITAVDLLRGIARLIGWTVREVAGATGYLDTDYRAKGLAAIDAISNDDVDLVAVHVEAPDEASHEGRVDAKIEALEAIDREIIGPVLEQLESSGDYRMLVTPDHPTPIRTRTHSHGMVPLVIGGTGIVPDRFDTYDEVAAAASPLAFDEGWRLMRYFLGRTS